MDRTNLKIRKTLESKLRNLGIVENVPEYVVLKMARRHTQEHSQTGRF